MIELAILLAAVLLALAFFAIARLRTGGGKKLNKGEGLRTCPLCSSSLAGEQRVNSRLFPGKTDRIMHIFGCPHCWPANGAQPRICPVCGKTLKPEGWVIARYFERPNVNGVKHAHVHVLGCTSCRESRR